MEVLQLMVVVRRAHVLAVSEVQTPPHDRQQMVENRGCPAKGGAENQIEMTQHFQHLKKIVKIHVRF